MPSRNAGAHGDATGRAAWSPRSMRRQPSRARLGSPVRVAIVPLVRTAVLTISTSVARRINEDEAGPLLAHLAEEAGAEIESMEVIPDDFGLIEDRLHHYVDDD